MRSLVTACAVAFASILWATPPAAAQSFGQSFLPRVALGHDVAPGAPGQTLAWIRQAGLAEHGGDIRSAMSGYQNAAAVLNQPGVAQDPYPPASQSASFFLLRAYAETAQARLAVTYPNVFTNARFAVSAATTARSDYLRALGLVQSRAAANPLPADRANLASIYRSLGYVDSIVAPLETVRGDLSNAQSIDPASGAKTASLARGLDRAMAQMRAHPQLSRSL